MARRVPLDRPEEAIRVVKEDGGVILTGFTSAGQVDKVNQDIDEIMTRRKSDEVHVCPLPLYARRQEG